MNKGKAFQVCVVCPACGKEMILDNDMTGKFIGDTDMVTYFFRCSHCILKFIVSFNGNAFSIADKMVCDYIKKV